MSTDISILSPLRLDCQVSSVINAGPCTSILVDLNFRIPEAVETSNDPFTVAVPCNAI